jgi:hypothetical protein
MVSMGRTGKAMAGCCALVLGVVAAGCAKDAPPTAGAASALPPAAPAKMTAQPAVVPLGRRISTLLDFESPQDLPFIEASPQSAQPLIDTSFARGGDRCLALASGTQSLEIKLPTLLEGRPFPADWALLGGYLYTDQPLTVTVEYVLDGQPVLSRRLAAGTGGWTPLMLNLDSQGGPGTFTSQIGVLRLAFAAPTPPGVRLDDVLLVDNHETVVDTTGESTGGGGWSVKRRGLYYVVAAPGRFSFAVPTAQAEQRGWAVADACAQRVRFTSPARPNQMTIYADGRLYWGEQFRPVSPTLSDAAELARQHALPAEISLPDAMGRVNRATPGDADNDGYNEARGAYELVAAGPRMELTITPRTPVLVRPVLEIAGLPAGNVRVTMEGRLVPGAVRLPDGDVLVELPGRIQRPTVVNIHVE